MAKRFACFTRDSLPSYFNQTNYNAHSLIILGIAGCKVVCPVARKYYESSS